MQQTAVDQRVEAVRRFNRLYTRQIGVLARRFLGSRFSLLEARVLYELAYRDDATASDLVHDLDLDPGYVSRTLAALAARGLIDRQQSPRDGRRQLVQLTAQGREDVALLEARQREDVAALLKSLAEADQRLLVEAMRAIERVLGPRQSSAQAYLLRAHQPGDMGWVVQQHGAIYAREYGWDAQIEAMAARIVAGFLEEHDPRLERCWIAEMEGAIAGSVFLIKQSEEVAKLRLLIVEPRARGLGIGARLVEECVRFARQAGYSKMTLWTQSNLTAARRIYAAQGFVLVASAPKRNFGHDLIDETWELTL